MDGSLLLIILVAVAATIPVAVTHELARGLAALLLTRGRVHVLLGDGRALRSITVGRLTVAITPRLWWGGETLCDAKTPASRSTLVHLAGPMAADVCFVAAAIGALAWPGARVEHGQAQLALFVVALVALVRASAELLDSRCTPRSLRRRARRRAARAQHGTSAAAR